MRDILKKSVLAGLGTAVVTKSKLQQTMNKMVEQGKLTSEEAEQYTKEILETGENEWKEIKEALNDNRRKLFSKLHPAEKLELEAVKEDVRNLEKRMDYLEERLNKNIPLLENNETQC